MFKQQMGPFRQGLKWLENEIVWRYQGDDMLLCINDLRKYFNLPEDISGTQMFFQLSDKSMGVTSYRAKMCTENKPLGWAGYNVLFRYIKLFNERTERWERHEVHEYTGSVLIAMFGKKELFVRLEYIT